jgi:hypothetical protein
MGKVIKFQRSIPEPTLEDPYAQVDWIFKEKFSLYENEDSKANYKTALGFYKRFLQETNNYNPQLDGDPRFYIKDEWDVMALHKVKQWVEATNIEGSENYRSSYSLISHFSAIRGICKSKTVNYLTEYKRWRIR